MKYNQNTFNSYKYYKIAPPNQGRKKGELLRYGRSKEKRTDSPLVMLVLTLNASGFPCSVEILPGNVSEPFILKQVVEKREGRTPTIIMEWGLSSRRTQLTWPRRIRTGSA